MSEKGLILCLHNFNNTFTSFGLVSHFRDLSMDDGEILIKIHLFSDWCVKVFIFFVWQALLQDKVVLDTTLDIKSGYPIFTSTATPELWGDSFLSVLPQFLLWISDVDGCSQTKFQVHMFRMHKKILSTGFSWENIQWFMFFFLHPDVSIHSDEDSNARLDYRPGGR